MNITETDPDLLLLELIGDDERGYDFIDDEHIIQLKQQLSSNGILSVYLDTRPETIQNHPVLTRLKNAIKAIREQQESAWNHDEKLFFEGVVDNITEILQKEQLALQGKGLALFAVPKRRPTKKDKIDFELFLTFHLPEAPVDLVTWGKTPVLSPLLVQRDEHPETGVVLFDKEKIRFFIYSMGEAAEYTITLHNDNQVPMTKGHSWHGYGTHNHQQWQKQHYHRYLRQTGIAISKIADKAGWKWLILASPDAQEAKHLVDFLPETLRSKYIGYTALAMESSLNDIRDHSTPIVRDAEIKAELELLKQWTHELEKPGGLAVSGIADTVQANQEYRLKSLIFPADYIQKGWQCASCGSLIADLLEKPPAQCPYCESGQLIEKTDIIGEIAIHLLQTGGEIEVVRTEEHRSIAEKNGFVGGLLRF